MSNVFREGQRIRLNLNGELYFKHPKGAAPHTWPQSSAEGLTGIYVGISDFDGYVRVDIFYEFTHKILRVHESQLEAVE